MSLQELFDGINEETMTKQDQLAILAAHLPAGSKRTAAAAASVPIAKKAKAAKSESEEGDVSDNEDVNGDDADAARASNRRKSTRRLVADGYSFAAIANERGWPVHAVIQHYEDGCDEAEGRRRNEVKLARNANAKAQKTSVPATIASASARLRKATAALELFIENKEAVLSRN